MNTQEFAQKIKAKYPVYKDMDDEELAAKVITKYPVYKDQIDDRPWMHKAIFKAEDYAKRVRSEGAGFAKGAVSTLTGVGSLLERGQKWLGRVATPKKYEERLGYAKLEEGEKTIAEKIVPEKIRTAEEDQKFGFAVEQVAEFFAPIPGKKISTLVKAGKWGMRAIKGAETTAEFAAKTAVQRGEAKLGDIGIGAAAVVAGGVVTKVGEVFFKNVPQWLMQKAIGQKAGDYLAGKDVSKFALDKKKMGSVDQLIKKGKVEIAKELERINRKFGITGKKNEVTAGSIRKSYYKLLDFLKKEKEEVSLEDLLSAKNNIRISIKEIAEEKGVTISKFDLESLIPRYKNVLQETALREALKIKSAAGKGSEILTFANLAPLVLGGLGGYHTESWETGALMGAAGYGMKSTRVLLGLGITTNMLKKAGPILQKLTPVERGILSQIIQRMTK